MGRCWVLLFWLQSSENLSRDPGDAAGGRSWSAWGVGCPAELGNSVLGGGMKGCCLKKNLLFLIRKNVRGW